MIDWRHWHNEPYLIGGLVFCGWIYALCVGPLRPLLAPSATFSRAHAWRFYGALVIFYLAVGSPLDQIGERFLFSAHMVQHLLLIYPAAVLWIWGLPSWLVDAVGRHMPTLGRMLLHPLVCGLTYIFVQSAWHVPALYDWALQDKFVHVVEHVTFFLGALLFWWPVMAPSTVWPPMRHGLRMVYLVVVGVGMTPLFAFIAFSPDVLYPTYEYAPRIINGFSAAEDQLLAGVIMKLGSVIMTFVALTVIFYQWYQASERRGPGVFNHR